MWPKVFHISVLVLYLYTLWYDLCFVELPFPTEELAALPLKGRCMFLTVWCFIIQIAYFSLASLCDILKALRTPHHKINKIRAIKDAMFCVAFPLATYVTTVFWALFHVDRELIFPESLSKIIPNWVNHTMHTAIFISMMVELATCSRKYLSRKIGVSTLLGINLAYVTCLFAIFKKSGLWVYPLFGVFSWPTRILFLLSNAFFTLAVYRTCEKMDDIATIVRREINVIKNTKVF